MKILKHGKYHKKNRIVICEVCGCKFKYKTTEIKKENPREPFRYYIHCPECKAIHCILDTLKKEDEQ